MTTKKRAAASGAPLTGTQPGTRPRRRWRTLGLEFLFLVALTVFGFSAASFYLGPSDQIGGVLELIQAAPASPSVGGGGASAYALFGAASLRPVPEPTLSPVFTPSVQYWREDILRWSLQYDVDPNLVATVMQIESCGLPSARSVASAQGLFQVMPFHFTEGEEMTDPDINAMRGIAYLKRGLEISNGHAGLALAGYNGGHSIISKDYSRWADETQRYYRWGGGIYREASAGWSFSPTLQNWYEIGGRSLCNQAEAFLGIQDTSALP